MQTLLENATELEPHVG